MSSTVKARKTRGKKAHNAAASKTSSSVRVRRVRGRNERNTAAIYGAGAPPISLVLPEGLTITLVELLVYLPKSLHNYYVLLRLVQAGINQQAIAHIVNMHRGWEKWPALTNSIGKATTQTMRAGCGDGAWTAMKHKKGEFTYDYEWDKDDLTFTGILLDCQMDIDKRGRLKNRSTAGIPFANLAADVLHHPAYTRGDGFMLSRCVQYAAANPGKNYVFPRDFAYLAKKLDDGRAVRAHHLDVASVRRWKKKGYWTVDEHPEVECGKRAEMKKKVDCSIE